MNINKIFLFLLISTIIFVGYKIIIKYNRLETFKGRSKKHKKNKKKSKKNKNKIIVKEEFNADETNDDETKPIIGVAANYNKTENKITALQYFYDKNKVHNSKKYDIGIKKIGDSSTKETIGDHDTGSDLTEKYNFMCPPNSAIYKVAGAYDSMGIRGLKFYCQDITTGKQVKAYNNNNRLVDGVTFGIEPNPSDENYHYDKSECLPHTLDGKQYPTFISKIDGEYDRKKKNIKNVSFNQCSLYYDN